MLFIAKECHSNDTISNIDSQFFAHMELDIERTGQKSKNQFLKGIAMLYNAYTNNDYINVNKSIKPLENIAFMNLNKRGGYAYCNWEILLYYVARYKDYIKKQIEIINPDIIICCGPSVKYLLDTYVDNKNEYKKIVAFHPSYFRASDKNKLKFFESNMNGTKYNPDQNEPSTGNVKDGSGLLFDTNNRYEGLNLEKYMIKNKVICAFGNSRRYLKSLEDKQYVLYYSSRRKGVIAIGEIKKDHLDLSEMKDFDERNADGYLVEPKAPTDFDELAKVLEDNDVPLISINEIKKSIIKKSNKKLEEKDVKFCWLATAKYPALEEKVVKLLIRYLNYKWKKYKQTL